MTLQNHISDLIRTALNNAQRDKLLPNISITDITVERSQKPEHGDFACNTALKLSRTMQTDPMSIAETISSLIPIESPLDKVWAIHPGFINFSLSHTWIAKQVDVILESGNTYGNITTGSGKHIQVEFVSVNPTGPIHVGHARGAVLGSALANVLEASGFEVSREYYINDAGSQIDAFARTLYVRYLQALGREAEVSSDGYLGAYMEELALEVVKEEGERFLELSEPQAVERLREIGLRKMIQAIRDDLDRIQVIFDVWFSEQELFDSGDYDAVMANLGKGAYLVQREGATWFSSTSLGEDKDNVLVRSSGAPTYFASDVAYHYNKFVKRSYDWVIDIWGADHQGHVSRMKAVLSALGVDPTRLTIILSQLVTLKRGKEVIRVSKRTGELITLKELQEEVGADACRFFFLSRSPDSQMDFDMELAKKTSDDNPVYYVQYAHARIAGILRLAKERGLDFTKGDTSLLTHKAELALIRNLLLLPEVIEGVSETLEPHHLPRYTTELASDFHWFYQQCRVISGNAEDEQVTLARLKLVEASRVVLARCLSLMDMSAPDRM